MSRLRQPLKAVLRYSEKTPDRRKVKRYYQKWRRQNGLFDRCDEPKCMFHTRPLVWNGEPLPLDLDHIDGDIHDNGAGNLRFLCPNCHRQTDTYGGANRGRVQNVSKGGVDIVDKKTGQRRKKMFVDVETGQIQAEGKAVTAPRKDG